MKNYILPLVFLLLFITATSQVGIGTTNPEAQLDIRSTNQTNPNNSDGILIPKIDEFSLTVPTAAKDGILVYASGNGSVSKGFYYWDNTISSWVALTGGSTSSDNDWYEVGTTTAPNDITDDIFTQGNVAIGKITADYPIDIFEDVNSRGLNVSIAGGSTNVVTYGLYVSNSHSGTAANYGIYNTLNAISDGPQRAIYNSISGPGNNLHYCIRNEIISTGDGIHYGIINQLSGTGSGAKYGCYTQISSLSGGTHYGVYSSVTKTGSFAGYFVGDVQILDGFLMLSDTATPTPVAGQSGIFSSSGELNVIDAVGNISVISPHRFKLFKPSNEMAWSFYSKNENLGKQVNVDMMKALQVLETLSGKQLVYIADLEGNLIVEKNNTQSLTSQFKNLQQKNELLESKLRSQKKELESIKEELDKIKIVLKRG